GPRRRRFYEVAPRMGEVARRVDADPRQARLWAERFPFVEGWEGQMRESDGRRAPSSC
ncbi:MAG: hypothetical protein M3T55_11930, partial [Pseudomonadota bacterium]|nr:hypothetical protein [Pseudomonadota bacterium]